MNKLPLNQVLCGDNREVMKTLPGGSIDIAVTSPPYWGLRDYGEIESIWGGDPDCDHEWVNTPPPRQRNEADIQDPDSKQATMRGTNYNAQEGNVCTKCGAWRGQLGLEPHPQMFIDHLIEVSQEIKRVIKPRGSYWLNLGDTYFGGGGGNYGTGRSAEQAPHPKNFTSKIQQTDWLQPKQLLGIPWRVAMALQEDGWILRNCVIWYKPNHMPESVKDRLTKSYEFMFFFVKQRKYYFNLDKIREPYAESSIQRINQPTIMRQMGGDKQHELYGDAPGHGNRPADILKGLAKNLTKHEVATGRIGNFSYDDPLHNKAYHPKGKNPGDMWEIPTYPFPGAHFAVFPPALIEPIIKAGCPKNGVVLDPFAGSGTALRVARKLGRRFIGIDINPEYVEMCERRVRADSYSPPPEGVPTLTELLDRE